MRVIAICITALGLTFSNAACSAEAEGPLTWEEFRDEAETSVLLATSVPELAAVDQSVTVDRAGPVNPVVSVSGPSTAYVLQSGRVRLLIEWAHDESSAITLPLQVMDDGSGPISYGVYPGQIAVEPEQSALKCPHCRPGQQVPCCP